MNLSKWVRQFHRWMALAFTAGFIINSVVIAMTQGAQPPSWVYLFALIPLFVLLPTGIYMYVQPHAAKWSARRAGG